MMTLIIMGNGDMERIDRIAIITEILGKTF